MIKKNSKEEEFYLKNKLFFNVLELVLKKYPIRHIKNDFCGIGLVNKTLYDKLNITKKSTKNYSFDFSDSNAAMLKLVKTQIEKMPNCKSRRYVIKDILTDKININRLNIIITHNALQNFNYKEVEAIKNKYTLSGFTAAQIHCVPTNYCRDPCIKAGVSYIRDENTWKILLNPDHAFLTRDKQYLITVKFN